MIRLHIISLASALILSSNTDALEEKFLNICMNDPEVNEQKCKCLATKIEEIMGPEYWHLLILSTSPDQTDKDQAEIESVKLGNKIWEFVGLMQTAIKIGSRQCDVEIK
jgi:hypothetical protein